MIYVNRRKNENSMDDLGGKVKIFPKNKIKSISVQNLLIIFMILVIDRLFIQRILCTLPLRIFRLSIPCR